VQRLWRIGLLSAFLLISVSSLNLAVRRAFAGPTPAASSSHKYKKQRKKEMKQKKLILKGRREKHKPKRS